MLKYFTQKYCFQSAIVTLLIPSKALECHPTVWKLYHFSKISHYTQSYLPTFLQGLEETSKEALKALLCWVVRMVRGRFGRRRSLLSLLPFTAAGLFADFASRSSSSLLPVTRLLFYYRHDCTFVSNCKGILIFRIKGKVKFNWTEANENQYFTYILLNLVIIWVCFQIHWVCNSLL